MSFQDTLRKNLTPELFNQVIDQLGDDFDFDLVPRSRLNQVIKQRNDLRNQVAGITQPADSELPDSEADSKDTHSIDVETLKKQWKEQSDKEIRDLKIQYAALDKLRAADIIDPEMVWSSNVIDKSKLSLDDSDQLNGLDEIITKLQTDKKHLFKAKEEPIPSGTGKNSSDDFGGVTTREDFLKLDADKQIAFKQANPEVFRTFMKNK